MTGGIRVGPLSSANGALPYIVFKRDKTIFASEFPDLEVSINHGAVYAISLSGLLRGLDANSDASFRSPCYGRCWNVG